MKLFKIPSVGGDVLQAGLKLMDGTAGAPTNSKGMGKFTAGVMGRQEESAPAPAAKESGEKSAPAGEKGAGVGDLGGIAGGLFNAIFGKDGSSKGQTAPGQSMMGGFDLDSFLEGSLKEARSSQTGNLGESIGGMMELLGINGKPTVGGATGDGPVALPQQAPGGGTPPIVSTSGPMPGTGASQAKSGGVGDLIGQLAGGSGGGGGIGSLIVKLLTGI